MSEPMKPMEIEQRSFEIITDPDDFSAVRETLEKEGIAIEPLKM